MINATNTHAEEAAVQRDADRLRLQGYQLHIQSVEAAYARKKNRHRAALERHLITNVALDAVLIGSIVTALTIIVACWIGGA